MVVNLGAYATEIIRAGVEAIPHGQTEAGAALGFSPVQTTLIILVPALKVIYPPLAGQFTMVLLGSSVASAISANELTSAANILSSANFRTLEVYLIVTFIYLIIVFVFRGMFALFYNLVLARDPEQRMRVDDPRPRHQRLPLHRVGGAVDAAAVMLRHFRRRLIALVVVACGSARFARSAG